MIKASYLRTYCDVSQFFSKAQISECSNISSACLGGGALSKNADNADAWEGGWWWWGDSDKMLTLLTLGSAGVKMLGLNK